MSTLRKMGLIGVWLFSAGCSQQAWYAGMQRSAADDCQQQPLGEIKRCEAHLNRLRFEDYEQERKRSHQP